jgi:hypothetical protein
MVYALSKHQKNKIQLFWLPGLITLGKKLAKSLINMYEASIKL